MSKFTESKWKINEYCDVLAENNQLIALINKLRNKKEAQANARLIAAAPEIYELLKEELIPTSDYGGILSFEREKKIRTLLARIDGEEMKQ